MNKYNGIMFTDLDGTLLNSQSKISKENLRALSLLEHYRIARTVCTGRTLNSAREVVPESLPFEYLIFSSGAGICEFRSSKMIIKHEFPQELIPDVANFFLEKQIDFCIHSPIPENHRFIWFEGKERTSDLVSKLHWLKDYAKKGSINDLKKLDGATQFLAISTDGENVINEFKKKFPELSVIRSTSTLNNKYTWIEVFPKGVSKGLSSEWLANYLNIKQSNTLGLGNDYNDMDMLDYAANSYVTENAPETLKNKYKTTLNNVENGFAHAVYSWLYDKFGDKTIKHRIITGEVNSGKSTYLTSHSLIDNEPSSGFICKKEFENGNHIGYYLLSSNSVCPIIRRNDCIPENWNEINRNARYSFSRDGFEFAYNTFYKAVNSNVKHFFIDEVAHLEKVGKGFGLIIREALARNIRLTLVIRESLIEQVTKFYGIENYEIINVEQK